MANEHFQFRQFIVWQDRCAMKVGTDGTLLGAWSQAPIGECRILDVGTGTALVALMMAQRYPQARLTAIDIDGDAVAQAQDNVMKSPFPLGLPFFGLMLGTCLVTKDLMPSSAIRHISLILCLVRILSGIQLVIRTVFHITI